jgi:hypothetical protein
MLLVADSRCQTNQAKGEKNNKKRCAHTTESRRHRNLFIFFPAKERYYCRSEKPLSAGVFP